MSRTKEDLDQKRKEKAEEQPFEREAVVSTLLPATETQVKAAVTRSETVQANAAALIAKVKSIEGFTQVLKCVRNTWGKVGCLQDSSLGGEGRCW